MFVVDLAGISAIHAAPAAGGIILAQFPCSNLNFVLYIYWLFPLIPLTLPLSLAVDSSLPPMYFLSFPSILMLAANCMFQRQDLDKAAPAGPIFASPPPFAPLSQVMPSPLRVSIWLELFGKN